MLSLGVAQKVNEYSVGSGWFCGLLKMMGDGHSTGRIIGQVLPLKACFADLFDLYCSIGLSILFCCLGCLE